LGYETCSDANTCPSEPLVTEISNYKLKYFFPNES